jgi:hypothetical protein
MGSKSIRRPKVVDDFLPRRACCAGHSGRRRICAITYSSLGLLFALCLSSRAYAAELSWPPCATIPLPIATASSVGTPSERATTPLPSGVERCSLKPGVTFKYRDDQGLTWLWTFMGYVGDPNDACVGNPPCAEWREDDSSGARWFHFYDGDNNRYKKYQAKTPTFANYPIPHPQTSSPLSYPKRLRWPLTIGDEWTNDYYIRLPDSAGIFGSTVMHQEVKVIGWETSRVRAGTFRVIHIRINNIARDSRFSFVQEEYYEPNLGIFVKLYQSDRPQITIELTAIVSKP